MSESLVLETEYQDLEDASEVERQKSMAQLNTAKVIKGERIQPKSSRERFTMY